MSQPHAPLSAQAARRLTQDTEPFLSCDDCFDLVDTYVEALLSDAPLSDTPLSDTPLSDDLLSDPGHDMPAMRTHLAGCAACAEEARSLIGLVAQQDGLDPARALRRLEDNPS